MTGIPDPFHRMVEPINSGVSPMPTVFGAAPAPTQYGPIRPGETLNLAKPWGRFPDGSFGYWPPAPVVNEP